MLINALVEDESSFAFSPDGTRLAYVAMDRTSGAAILMVHDLGTGAVIAMPGSLPIPGGSGSSLPEARELSWSPDGKFLVFDFGRNAADSAIYLAYADGTGLIKVADSAYAPAISSDGKCLAYISNQQVFLMDLTSFPSSSTTQVSILLSDLLTGRGIPNFRQDKLEWRP
jgi:Tol biopolymer transport system component